MKESTLKKYNKTQLENYASKAKSQIQFWQEELELANKVLATKTTDFPNGLYIADFETSEWSLVAVKDGGVTEANTCNPLLNLYGNPIKRPLKIKLVKGQYKFQLKGKQHTLKPLLENNNFEMEWITNFLLLNDYCYTEVTNNIKNYLSDKDSAQVKFVDEFTECLNKIYNFNLHGDYYTTGIFQFTQLDSLKNFIEEHRNNKKLESFLHEIAYFYTNFYRIVNPQTYVFKKSLEDINYILENLKRKANQ